MPFRRKFLIMIHLHRQCPSTEANEGRPLGSGAAAHPDRLAERNRSLCGGTAQAVPLLGWLSIVLVARLKWPRRHCRRRGRS